VARRVALPPRHRDALEGERRGRNGLVQLVDAIEQVPELEAPEHLLQLRPVRRREHELGRVGVELEGATRSRRMVASSFAARACSACSLTAFERAGVSSSACSRTSSSDPYCAISCPAVLSPIPGIPGMLSDGSPLSPMKSGTWSGRIPSLASTRSGVTTRL